MPTGHDVCREALRHRGKRYVFGAEARCSDPNPSAFDCSELTEYVHCRLGVYLPDGVYGQLEYGRRKRTLIPVGQATGITGALLLRGPNEHVAVSLGNGSTIEAANPRVGVQVLSAFNRGWTHGMLVPGVSYGPRPAEPAASDQSAAVRFALARMARARELLPSARNLPTPLGPGLKSLYVVVLQRVVNCISPERRLVEDGMYGPATSRAVADFQRFFNLPPTGVWDAQTKWLHVLVLQNVADGR